MHSIRRALFGGLVGLGVAVMVGAIAGIATAASVPVEPHGPSVKATRLAAGISTAMNCAAAVSLVAVPAMAAAWLRKARRA